MHFFKKYFLIGVHFHVYTATDQVVFTAVAQPLAVAIKEEQGAHG